MYVIYEKGYYGDPDYLRYVCKSKELAEKWIELYKKLYPSLDYYIEEADELTQDVIVDLERRF